MALPQNRLINPVLPSGHVFMPQGIVFIATTLAYLTLTLGAI
jgi:hypothetical protein